jgi:hypothetical protein
MHKRMTGTASSEDADKWEELLGAGGGEASGSSLIQGEYVRRCFYTFFNTINCIYIYIYGL